MAVVAFEHEEKHDDAEQEEEEEEEADAEPLEHSVSHVASNGMRKSDQANDRSIAPESPA